MDSSLTDRSSREQHRGSIQADQAGECAVKEFTRSLACVVTLLLTGGGVARPDTLPWAADGPAPRAMLFAPGTVSTGDDDAHVTFSPDGHTVYFLKDAPD